MPGSQDLLSFSYSIAGSASTVESLKRAHRSPPEDRSDEHTGRCSIAVETTRRMDAGSCASSEDIYGILVTSGRPICITEKQAVELVLLHRQAPSPFPGDGRTTPRLEISEQATVCISPPPHLIPLVVGRVPHIK